MTSNLLFTPNQPISTLTIADLEKIIAEVVRRVLREEMQLAAESSAKRQLHWETLLSTFGTWEDPRPPQDVATEIFTSRTVSAREISL